MSYIRQAFGNAGDDRVSGVITKRHFVGFLSGAIGGLGLGVMVLGFSVGAGVVALVCGIGGLATMIEAGGMRIADRIQLRAAYLVRRVMGGTGVPPSSPLRALAKTPTITYDGAIIARPYDASQPSAAPRHSPNGRVDPQVSP